MGTSTRITVQKGGVKVFAAESGRLGVDDSAFRDYACFSRHAKGVAFGPGYPYLKPAGVLRTLSKRHPMENET